MVMVEEERTRRLLKEGHRVWSALLGNLSGDQSLRTVERRGAGAEEALNWKKTVLEVSGRKKSLGITLAERRFGSLVLGLRSDSPLYYLLPLLQGAVLLEVNGVVVFLETFESLTKSLYGVESTGV